MDRRRCIPPPLRNARDSFGRYFDQSYSCASLILHLSAPGRPTAIGQRSGAGDEAGACSCTDIENGLPDALPWDSVEMQAGPIPSRIVIGRSRTTVSMEER